MNKKYFKVKIVQHTPLLIQNSYVDVYHKNKIGNIILVREPQFTSAYYECKTGESILKTDCIKVAKR